MTTIGHFQIVTCCGDFVKNVDYPVDMGRFLKYDWADFDVANDYWSDVLNAAGIENYECQGCYDLAYKVRFIGYTDHEGRHDYE